MAFPEIIIIQPPLVQLNTPYPSGAYLSSFFHEAARKADLSGTGAGDCRVTWHDLSIALFHRIFSRQGLTQLFAQTYAQALEQAADAEKRGEDEVAFNLRRYVTSAPHWISWIDDIVDILCRGQREKAHEFVRSAHVPRGARMERYLSELGRDVSVDDAHMLATLALADLADYVTAVFDEQFALIRYAEALAASTATFEEISAAAESPVMNTFYAPILDQVLAPYEERTDRLLFLVTVPFAGTFAAALRTCREIKRRFGPRAVVSMGGGYPNTALRSCREPRLSEYVDFLSFDRGYAFYDALLENWSAVASSGPAAASGFASAERPDSHDAPVGVFRLFDGAAVTDFLPPDEFMKREEQYTRTLVPDYSGIDFLKYPRVADDVNPMHRIWSDGAWVKAYLAHGCYWHRCAFCDTRLDYVCNYKPVETERLFEGLSQQAEKSGAYGIHFVDEAAPPVALRTFAQANCRSPRRRLSFWGNIRFEKSFTRDLADFLAYGGLTGVSGGIEIASGEGLADINKGIDIDGLVGACAAFKEAGVLVHAYMIYGFYNETPQMLIDSAETLRQLIAAGLVDSAFWHKFTLTRHSTVYHEWLEGNHPDLKPTGFRDEAAAGAPQSFAEYELHFAGEKKSVKYGAPLTTALEAWMHGHGLNKPVQKWFPFDMPSPRVPADFIDKAIARYEKRRDEAYAHQLPDSAGALSGYAWLGGKPCVLSSSGGRYQLCWTYMGTLMYADVPGSGKQAAKLAEEAVAVLWDMRPENTEGAGLHGTDIGRLGTVFRQARGNGLVKI